eukprot:m.21135 g.21135  ORF g.21135 m.21135 type:complete len:76 (+) comp11102_c0_seq2:180-407(+)
MRTVADKPKLRPTQLNPSRIKFAWAAIFFLGAVGLVSARLGLDAAKHEHLRQELLRQKAAKAAEKDGVTTPTTSN